MATFDITSPDGTKYRVNAPEGASEADALAYVRSHHQAMGGSAPKDDLPADVPATGAQMKAAERTEEAVPFATPPGSHRGQVMPVMVDAKGNVSLAVPEFIAAPLRGMVKGGQAALGERPAMSVSGDPDLTAAASLGADAGFGSAIKAPAVEAKPWTPGQIETTAKALGAPVAAKARQIVESRINKTTPTTAQEAIDTLNKARASGKPMMLPDVLQGGVQKLAGRMARAPGDSSEIMTRALRERNAGSVERLTGDINAAFGEEGAYDANQALMAARKTAAKPAYDEAYAHPPINPDEMKPDGGIGSMLDRPSVRAGMANARKIAAEEGVDMNTLGIDLDAQGEPRLVRVPTWQTLDYIKRGIDNVVEQYRDKTTGKLMLDTYGRAADITRGEFVKTLRDLNKPYGRALDAWSGPSRSMDALEVGKDALKFSPEQNAARIAEMSPNDREFARLGVGQMLRDIANKRGPLAGEFDRIAGTQYGSKSTREQLRPFFSSDKAYEKFIDSVTAETVMPRTANKILGGSQTAERLAEDEGGISPADVLHGGSALALGHHGPIWRIGREQIQRLWDRKNPELNAHIARILGATDTTLGRDAAGRIVINRPETPP